MAGIDSLLGIRAGQKPLNLAGVRVQTSLYSLPIPIVYGQARVTGNLIEFPEPPQVVKGGKKAQTASKKSGQGAQGAQHYFAPVVVGLCEGEIAGIGLVWVSNDSPVDFASMLEANDGWVLFNGGSDNGAPWTYLTANHPGRALFYPGLAYVANPRLELPGGQLQNYSWEIKGLLPFGGGIVDANAKDIITDFLTNVDHGLGWPSSKLGDLTPYGNYVTAAGLFLSAVIDQQQPAGQYLGDLLAATNSTTVWSDGELTS